MLVIYTVRRHGGGQYGLGAIFSITPVGQETLGSTPFSGGLDGSRPNSALLIEGGALYGHHSRGRQQRSWNDISRDPGGSRDHCVHLSRDCENSNTQLGVGIAMTGRAMTRRVLPTE